MMDTDTADTVRARVREFGPEGAVTIDWPRVVLADALELRSMGWSFAAIGKRIGKERNACAGKFRRMGV